MLFSEEFDVIMRLVGTSPSPHKLTTANDPESLYSQFTSAQRILLGSALAINYHSKVGLENVYLPLRS
jgi:hypothetical protein